MWVPAIINKSTLTYLLVCIFFCVSNSLSAQLSSGTFDSLHLELQKIPTEDTSSTSDFLVEAMYRENQRARGQFDAFMANVLLEHYLEAYNDLTPVQALPRLREIETKFQTLKKIDPLVMAKFHNQFVIEFRSLSQNDSLVKRLDLMAEQLTKVSSPTTLKITLEYERARHAYLQNDFQGSLTYLQYALQYLDENFPDEVLLRLNLLNGIGIGYRRTNQSAEAIDHHLKTIAYLKIHPEHASYEGNILNNLGLCHADLGNHKKAIYYMQEAVNSYMDLGARYTDQIASGYVNMAGVYSGMGEVDSAVIFNRRSLKLMRETYGDSYADQLLPLASLAEIYNKVHEFHLADSVCQLALTLLQKLGWSRAAPAGDYYMYDAFDLLSFAITAKTELYKMHGNLKYLTEAIDLSDDFMATVDYAMEGLKNAISKEVFQERRGPTFSLAIDNLYTLYELTQEDSLIAKALQYSEKLKSLELLYAAIKDRINENETYQKLNAEYEDLIDSILPLEKKLALAQDSSDQWREIIQDQLVNAQHSLSNWRGMVTKEYPQYQQIIFHPEKLQISDIQHNYLSSDQSLLSYHVADQSLYGICINKQGISFKKIDIQFALAEEIENLRNNVYGYFVSGESSEARYVTTSTAYTRAARRLYEVLFQPFEDDLKGRVILIPDKALAYLPFDLLLSEEPSEKLAFKAHPYLMKKYALSYCYSVNLWLEIASKSKSANKELLAFAPAFRQADIPKESLFAMRAGLAPLDYNYDEVDGIQKHFEGRIFSGSDATKTRFLEEVKDFGIIHLATHSKANDASGDFSYLAFSNESDHDYKLYANEIYALRVNADLVTLSACESGIGEMRNGEGLISLARAFIFAGAKSILSTLWAVNDKSTGELMTLYYQNLALKMPKDLALQKAKIKYLQDHDHTAAHPFFWSGFIMIGDQSPIVQSSSIWYWGILLALALVALFWRLRKRKG